MTVKFSPKYLAHILIGITASVAGTTWSTASRAAGMINVELPYNLYGHESNIGGRCAATSMINSFVYLNNIRPDLYASTKLLTGAGMDLNGDGVVDLKDSIIELDNKMGGFGCGVNRKQAWEGKLNWFDMYAPNTTTFAGMVDEDCTGWNGSQYLTKGVPTIDFLLGELRAGEDIELRIGFDDGSGHYLTLTSLHIDDMDMNGMWTPGEMVSIDYIDPNCPAGMGPTPGPSVAPITNPDGTWQFNWSNCGNKTPQRAKITAAWAESPRVPEPSSVFGILAVGGLGLTRIWKKRK
ncbi:MAG: PEP-CTERM sorting domain-containing protein [Microcystis sp.]